MTTNTTAEKVSVLQLFTETTESVDWGTIDDLYKVVITNEQLVTALLAGDIREQAIKRGIRQLIKKVPNDAGHCAYASVKHTDAEGKEVTLYKQETLFNVDDYRYVVDYHGQRKLHHANEERYYARRCHERFAVQIDIPFSE